jgi:hypothetical protein
MSAEIDSPNHDKDVRNFHFKGLSISLIRSIELLHAVIERVKFFMALRGRLEAFCVPKKNISKLKLFSEKVNEIR